MNTVTQNGWHLMMPCIEPVVQRVEKSPGELQVSDCQSMLKLWECVYPKA